MKIQVGETESANGVRTTISRAVRNLHEQYEVDVYDAVVYRESAGAEGHVGCAAFRSQAAAEDYAIRCLTL